MSKDLLAQLKEITTVVADTSDFESIKAYKPQGATTNPSLITKAANMPQYQVIVDDTLRDAKQSLGDGATQKQIVTHAFDHLAIAFGLKILEIVPGRVSTEVDARLSYDTNATIGKARELISYYENAGVNRKRILIKIASTWEGIQAAKVLEKEGIHCNLTLLFGIHQAIACAENNITLISPFVGRILDWYKKDTGREAYPAAEDPGVLSVTQIYNYYKKFAYKTEIMGASFRNIGEIQALAGCDLLTISPKFMNELSAIKTDLPRKLDPEKASKMDIKKIQMDKQHFDAMHNENIMAKEKLAEGIKGFSKALESLEELLAARLKMIR